MSLPSLDEPDLERAVRRAISDVGEADAGAAPERLLDQEVGDRLLDALVGRLNVGETYFFRDPEQMRFIEEGILPQLIASRRSQRRLRLWSAGCSTGEEAYSLGITLLRHLPDLEDWDVLILATDINGHALEIGRKGIYGDWSLRNSPPAIRSYFRETHGRRFELNERVRSMVTFRRLDLATDGPSWPANQAIDVILCRNVLLYFDRDAARSVTRRLRSVMADDGWLLVSQVEASLDVFERFEPGSSGTAAYRKEFPAPAELPVPRAIRGARARTRPKASVVAAPDRTRKPAAPRPAAGAPPEEENGRDVYGRALALWRAGRPDDALGMLGRENDRHPLDPSLPYLRALIMLDRGDMQEAMIALRRCTYADPDFAPAHLAQGTLFVRLGLPDRAESALRHAVRLVEGADGDVALPGGHGVTAKDLLDLAESCRELIGRGVPREAVGG
jgi:chemotaxis protein methyltransferase CheR